MLHVRLLVCLHLQSMPEFAVLDIFDLFEEEYLFNNNCDQLKIECDQLKDQRDKLRKNVEFLQKKVLFYVTADSYLDNFPISPEEMYATEGKIISLLKRF